MNKGKIFVAGGLGLDIIPVIKSTESIEFIEGSSKELNDMVYYVGGQTGNTGRILNKLGSNVIVQGKIGRDVWGEIIKNLLQYERINSHITIADNVNTSTTVVLSGENRDRMFLYRKGASQMLKKDEIDFDLIRTSDIFHFGYPTTMENMYANNGKELVEMMYSAKCLGITTSMDMSMPDVNSDSGKQNWKLILKQVLPYVDIFMPSIEEIDFMLHKEEYLSKRKEKGNYIDSVTIEEMRGISQELHEMGCFITMLKCGYKGLFLKTKKKENNFSVGRGLAEIVDLWSDKEIYTSPFYVEKVVCANGAGDAAVAGLLNALSRGKRPEEAIKLSALVAAQSLLSYNVTDKICSVDELEKIIL